MTRLVLAAIILVLSIRRRLRVASSLTKFYR